MKDLIEKIRNIFKIPELKERIIYTVLLLAVFRLGSYIILPGIDSEMLSEAFNAGQGEGKVHVQMDPEEGVIREWV